MTALLEPSARALVRPPLAVALVNNMPDSAFNDTEDQFRRAMAAGTDDDGVDLELYTIKEIPRSEALASVIESRYHGLDELWTSSPDALIVTGTEPAQAKLRYEPYWPYLARLLEWATSSVPTTLLSCLAAHASILLFDGIDRVPRAAKCSGVFEGVVEDPTDPLATGLPEIFPMPHSRVNDVPEAALAQAGYRIVVGSGASKAGWAVAARNHGDGLFVACQGHPEYHTLQPAAGVPARRAPIPVRPRRDRVPAPARRVSVRRGRRDTRGVRVARDSAGRGSARSLGELPVR